MMSCEIHPLQQFLKISLRDFWGPHLYDLLNRSCECIGIVVHCLHNQCYKHNIIWFVISCAQTVCRLKEAVHIKRWPQSTERTTSWVWCPSSWRVVFPTEWGDSASSWPAAESLQVLYFLLHNADSIHNCFNKAGPLFCLYITRDVYYNIFVTFEITAV